ncbi:MAG: queuosine salvage family protein [Deltaproteobacteria bacterium]|nr:queuosine salvage family protein [Deltaproteobacteria bacterium]
MFEVLETSRIVANKSVHVRIDERAVTELCKTWVEEGISVPPWDSVHHFKGVPEDTIAYIFVLDALNFCFWPPPGRPRWEIEYESRRFSGYYALSISLKRAIGSGIPIIKADFLANITLKDLKQVLRGKGELPLLKERVEILRELGQVLLDEYHGEAYRLLEAAEHSAPAFVHLASEKFPSFRDVAKYGCDEVFFYKRAQILASDLYGVFNGAEQGHFIDVDELTAFADYKLPQVLRHLGVLRYKPGLTQKVDHGILLEGGSIEEIEIRANTIWAVELIRQEMEALGRTFRAFEIDGILWNMGQDEAFRAKPYHRTMSIYY